MRSVTGAAEHTYAPFAAIIGGDHSEVVYYCGHCGDWKHVPCDAKFAEQIVRSRTGPDDATDAKGPSARPAPEKSTSSTT